MTDHGPLARVRFVNPNRVGHQDLCFFCWIDHYQEGEFVDVG